MILLDTDHLSVLTDSRAAGNATLVQRLDQAGEPLAIPIVAVEEQCKGWLARLGRTRDTHQQITPVSRFRAPPRPPTPRSVRSTPPPAAPSPPRPPDSSTSLTRQYPPNGTNDNASNPTPRCGDL